MTKVFGLLFLVFEVVGAVIFMTFFIILDCVFGMFNDLN